MCGGVGSRHPVEAHERWLHDPSRRVATLVDVEALCPACHQVKHCRPSAAVLDQLARVNAWTQDEARVYTSWVTTVRECRTRRGVGPGTPPSHWRLDLSWLLVGLTYKSHAKAEDLQKIIAKVSADWEKRVAALL